MQFAKLSVLLTGVAILMVYFVMASRTCCCKKPCCNKCNRSCGVKS